MRIHRRFCTIFHLVMILTLKSSLVIFVHKSIKIANLVTFPQAVCKISFNKFCDARMDGRKTDNLKILMSLHKQSPTNYEISPVRRVAYLL